MSSSSSSPAKPRQGNARNASQNNANAEENRVELNMEISILNLPSEVLVEIFVRLPALAIIYCKGVCKVWYDLLSSSRFTNLYVRNPSFIHIVLFNELNTRNSSNSMAFRLLEFGEDIDHRQKSISDKRLNIPKKDSLIVTGSCNGLLCLVECYNKSKIIHISNPILGEYISLPPLKEDKNLRPLVYGFGFSNNYKVLSIQSVKFLGNEVRAKVQIYTIGVDKEWRELVVDDFKMCSLRGSAVIVNEAFHWIRDLKSLPEENFVQPGIISTFDIGKEEFRSIPLPPVVNDSIILGEMRSCLCVFDNSRVLQLEIWTMKEYGNVQSWTKDIILRSWMASVGVNMVLHTPITIWRNGEILMCGFGNPHLISFNPTERNAYALKVSSFESISYWDIDSQQIMFIPSFVSVKDLAGEGYLRVLKV